MLRRLSISNYALIDVLDIEVPEHLVIITGDSGAGKSILLGALALLLGGKTDSQVHRDQSKNCVIEAEFDDHIVRRVISPAMRSRVFIDDEPATLEQIRAIAMQKVDIHSQNSQLLLDNSQFRLSVVDSYAGTSSLLSEYQEAYNRHSALVKEWNEVCLRRHEAERNRDYNQFRWSRLDAASLEAGELELLESEQATLANSELIKETLAAALDVLSEGEESLDSRLKSVGHSFGKITDCLPGSEELRQRIESCRIELKDISASLEENFRTVDSAPERLDIVENRIALIYDLMQKNGAESYDRLLEIRDAYRDELSATDDLSQQEAALAAEVGKAEEECSRLCCSLSEAREAVLERLSDSLQNAIRDLEMPRARFEVRIERKTERTSSGADDVIFAFSSAGGPVLKDLTKCASGGEMSRIMLCVKSLLAEKSEMPTVIFDEIDTGISGALADKVGQKIVSMGENAQVIAITHLPQVAVKGNAHFLVYKEYAEQSASSHIRKIEGEERVEEIARMISGSTITPEALAAARVLLDRATPAPIMRNLF